MAKSEEKPSHVILETLKGVLLLLEWQTQLLRSALDEWEKGQERRTPPRQRRPGRGKSRPAKRAT